MVQPDPAAMDPAEEARQRALTVADDELVRAQQIVAQAREKYLRGPESEMLASIATSISALGRLVVVALREDVP